MKKVSVLLALLMLLTAFVSCKGFVPETAEELWEKVDETMDELDSYKMHTEMDMTFYIKAGSKSYEAKAGAKGDMIRIDTGKDYYYYESMEMQSSVEELDKSSTITNVMAYQNGQMYLSCVSEDDGLDQHIRGTVSVEDFKAHLDEASGDSTIDDTDLLDCATKSFEKTEDGDWKLTLSGYTKKAIDSLWDDLALGDTVDFDIEDMEIEILIDEDFRAKKIEMTPVFSEESGTDKPTLLVTMEFSEFNEAERITDTIKNEDYTEVDDILLVSSLEDMVEELVEKDDGKVEMELKATFKNNSSIEYDTITYGIEDGDFYYHILSISGNTRIVIEYKDGQQSVRVVGGSTSTKEQDLREAKNTVKQMFEQIQYESNKVSDVTKVQDGVYRIESAALNPSEYDSLFGGSYTCGSASRVITVTLEDGEIKEIVSELTALTKRTNYELKYTVKLVVEK